MPETFQTGIKPARTDPTLETPTAAGYLHGLSDRAHRMFLAFQRRYLSGPEPRSVCRYGGVDLSLTEPVMDELTSQASVVSGVGPDAPVIVNEHGGKQSGSPYRCDLLPPLAVLAVAKVLKHGADKYGENNWHKIPVNDHLNHVLTHILAYTAGDKTDDHLEHAACRVLFALDQLLAGR